MDAFTADLGQPVADRLLPRFLAEADEAVHALTAADKPLLNLSEPAETEHKLAGAAATFGALALHEALARIAPRAKSEDPDMAPLLAPLGQIWTETREASARPAGS
ncbi:hypothetical protein GCM10023209_13630 [Roseibacterium beibuensis]|uniref:HPt domain-containing protein n=1 Tax=[Roseibacterium] beibuensis TaxID=1193142 RepID=A0ABP9L470_9RHOB